jgi:tetraacyldisaccharide 4'-kinase
VSSLLFPFSLIYGLVMRLRNAMYDRGILKSHRFDLPVIAVGNLRVGGTGKTPMVDHIVRSLESLNVAIVSRGYGRKSTGFHEVISSDTSAQCGDEPLQLKRTLPHTVVAVDESRVRGINTVLDRYPRSEVVILDDAYQHRAVKPALLILLTAYSDLYCEDFVLPQGRLREPRSGAQRAAAIVVTKCPEDLALEESTRITLRLKPLPHQQVFFATEHYDSAFHYRNTTEARVVGKTAEIILVTGLADASRLKDYVSKTHTLVKHFDFSDHHNFTETEMKEIVRSVKMLHSEKAAILTTMKDFQRMEPWLKTPAFAQLPLHIQPVSLRFLFDRETVFNQLVHGHLRKGR